MALPKPPKAFNRLTTSGKKLKAGPPPPTPPLNTAQRAQQAARAQQNTGPGVTLGDRPTGARLSPASTNPEDAGAGPKRPGVIPTGAQRLPGSISTRDLGGMNIDPAATRLPTPRPGERPNTMDPGLKLKTPGTRSASGNAATDSGGARSRQESTQRRATSLDGGQATGFGANTSTTRATDQARKKAEGAAKAGESIEIMGSRLVRNAEGLWAPESAPNQPLPQAGQDMVNNAAESRGGATPAVQPEAQPPATLEVMNGMQATRNADGQWEMGGQVLPPEQQAAMNQAYTEQQQARATARETQAETATTPSAGTTQQGLGGRDIGTTQQGLGGSNVGTTQQGLEGEGVQGEPTAANRSAYEQHHSDFEAVRKDFRDRFPFLPASVTDDMARASDEGKAAIEGMRSNSSQERLDSWDGARHEQNVEDYARGVASREGQTTMGSNDGSPRDVNINSNNRDEGSFEAEDENGNEYDLIDPETYPPSLNAELEERGITPDEFADSMMDKWVDEYYPHAGPELRATLIEVGRHGRANDLYLDDEKGITDANGDVVSDTTLAALTRTLDGSTEPRGRVETDLVNGIKARLAKERGEDAPQTAAEAEAETLKNLEEEADKWEAEYSNLEEQDASQMIADGRAAAAVQNAKAMRLGMNRMARAGSSPEAIQGTTAALDMEQRTMLAQQEAVLTFQVETQNIDRKMQMLRDRAIWANQAVLNAKSEAERIAAQATLDETNRRGRELQMKQEAAANKMDWGMTLAKIGIGAVGAAAGVFTGGLATAGAGALIGALGGTATTVALGGGGNALLKAVTNSPKVPQYRPPAQYTPSYSQGSSGTSLGPGWSSVSTNK